MITLNRSADIAFRTLLPQEQKPVMQSISLLENFPKNSMGDRIIKLGEGDEKVYAMKITPQFDIIFQVLADNNKEILEIFPSERIKNYVWSENQR